jgi:hypothetical protein
VKLQDAVTSQQPTFFSCSFYQTVLLVSIKTHKKSPTGQHKEPETVYTVKLYCREAARTIPFQSSACGVVIECKLAMCICRLVEFELLLELKFEQKKGTSLHTACCRLCQA